MQKQRLSQLLQDIYKHGSVAPLDQPSCIETVLSFKTTQSIETGPFSVQWYQNMQFGQATAVRTQQAQFVPLIQAANKLAILVCNLSLASPSYKGEQLEMLRLLANLFYFKEVVPQAVLLELPLPQNHSLANQYYQLLSRTIPPCFQILLFRCKDAEQLTVLSQMARLPVRAKKWLMLPIWSGRGGRRASQGLLY